MKAIITTQTFSSKIQTVWKAITERDQMVQWFFDNIPDFKAEKGFYTEFNVKAESRDFLHQWEVLEVDMPNKMVVSWKYEGFNGEAIVTFKLSEEGNQTTLTVTAEGIESFPQDVPEFRPESCQGGWDYFIKERLADYLK